MNRFTVGSTMLERIVAPVVLLLLVAAGCLGPPATPPDASTPPIGPVAALTVRVADVDGQPLADVDVFVVAADLKEPLNNVDVFESGREATRHPTDADGVARIELEPGTWVVAADAPDRYRSRHVVGVLDQDVEVEIVVPGRAGPGVVAHRGGAHHAPENTMVAFRKAVAMGADVVEFDVRLTADNRLVLMHDTTVDRTTNGTGFVRDLTLAELRALDAGTSFRPAFAGEGVPSLEEALEWFAARDVRLFVDVKSDEDLVPETMQRTIQMLRDWNLTHRSFVASTHVHALETCQAEADVYCLFMVGADRTEEEAILTFKGLAPDGLRIRHDRLTTTIRDEVHAAGKDLFTGAPNAPHQWRRVVDLGVDYVGTDRPGDLLEFLAEDAVWRHAQVPASA